VCITIIYTVIGGLKAVIYTDTIQWVLLLSGLIFVTIPVTLWKIGGLGRLRAELPSDYFSLTNVEPVEFINWMVTIIPIWLVGMTLYQRMYACKNEKEAKKAWFIAGFFEYPVMAFTGVFLGMCARVMFPDAESEMAMPMLIKDVLPVGVTGIVIAAYFSAIMSTADSCLMASSGNLVNDILQRYCFANASEKFIMRLSQAVTLLIGVAAVVIAARFEKVLDLIFDAYAFMVAGLFVPTLGAYFWKKSSSTGAFAAMLAGGFFTLGLLRSWIGLPESVRQVDLHPSVYGIAVSLIVFVIGSSLFPDRNVNLQKGEIGV
jgi:SSS family solute:Na+ symporter